MAFNSELGGESAASKDVCLCERGITLSAYEEGVVFFFLHLWMCTPQPTSNESLLALKVAVEYAWMVWSEPLVLASSRICP